MFNSHVLRMVKLATVFTVAFSLASLPGPISSNLHLPTVSLANACVVLCASFEAWYPSGAAMDTLNVPIFTDATAEFNCLLQSQPCVDLTDSPFPPLTTPCPPCGPPNLVETLPVSLHRYYDIQFMLANNFWGVDFNFGNDANGVQIRQGIAHLIDKAKFAVNEPSIAGSATALDNPLPPNNGGLPTPNPCLWDTSFAQSGPNCVVGSLGGTAYHLANATGANGMVWLPAPGSLDLNAASQHFVNAGIATGFNPATSVLTGISAAAAAHVPNIFIRNDDPARLHMGDSLAEEICYLFTGAYTIPCAYLNVIHGPITAFSGFDVQCGAVCLNWWMYTGAFSDVFPFDASLSHTYNSRFVSGIPSIRPPCSNSSVSSVSPANYMYLCSPSYDSISNQMEFSPCLNALGDPTPGTVNNGPGANCPGTTQLSAISAGIQTEDAYGKGAYSIPVFDITSAQFAYLNNWQRVINGDGSGIPNFFTWLDAHSPNPAVPGTVRQGFSTTTRGLNPYTAETVHDLYILHNIYDSLSVKNPLDNGQLLNWMTINEQSNLPPSALTYIPPPGTVGTFRFTLRQDLFFQDGRKVTSFDVAFSYLSMIATGAFQGVALSSITGITVLGPAQFDINVNGAGPFTLFFLTSPTVLPASYWTSAGSKAWDSAASTCTATGASCYPAQYTLNPSTGPFIGTSTIPSANCALNCTNFPAGLMNINPPQSSATYDPITAHTLVGSGAYTCGTVTSSGSGACSSSGAMNPPVGGSYSLTRFGKGLSPASSVSSIYFRSNGNLALWTWSQDNGDTIHDFLNFSVVSACFGKAPLPLGPSADPCAHFQQGIGTSGATTPGGTGGCPVGNTCGVSVSLQQVLIVNRFVGLNWVSPFNWQSLPPTGIGSFAPVLYEGSITLNPASVAGCLQAYPAGGYDC